MTSAKVKEIALKVVVTFVEAALAYSALNNFDITNKTAVAGAIGAGLSAVYNLSKHYLDVDTEE